MARTETVQELRTKWQEVLEAGGGTTCPPHSITLGHENLTTPQTVLHEPSWVNARDAVTRAYRAHTPGDTAPEGSTNFPSMSTPPVQHALPPAQNLTSCQAPNNVFKGLLPLVIICLTVIALMLLYVTRPRGNASTETPGEPIDTIRIKMPIDEAHNDDELAEIEDARSQSRRQPLQENPLELPRALPKTQRGESRIPPNPLVDSKEQHDPMFQGLRRQSS